MLEKKKGSIIATSSVAGLKARGLPVSHCYGATKAGMIGFVRHSALAYAKDGIRINAIAPGAHETKAVGMKLTPEEVEFLKQTLIYAIPMGRVAQPCEIRGLAVFLASDASSRICRKLKD